jgi:predicted DNA-binding protein
LKLTPEQIRRLFKLSEQTGLSFVSLCQMAIEIGLKQLEELEIVKQSTEE